MRRRNASRRRPGLVSLWAVLVLGIIGSLCAVVTMQGLAQRRLVEHRQEQLQAEWLANSGLELAAERLRADPAGYQGETVAPIPRSRVQITVEALKDRPDTYRVSSEARYPTDRKQSVLLTRTRTYQRSPSLSPVPKGSGEK